MGGVTESELRALIRAVVAERQGPPAARSVPVGVLPGTALPPERHVSHARLRVLPGAEAGGPCLVEPAVGCHFCGYCQSYGH